jgi:U1 small nuclear ribonucleoprotein
LSRLGSGASRPHPVVEQIPERKARLALERQGKSEERISREKASWDPLADPHSAGTDAFKTLFVANLCHRTEEADLRKVFERYGPVKRVRIIQGRGYAFVEFSRTSDMKAAYKECDGKVVLGREIIVDYERARTVDGWLPRRLGGGKGKTRATRPKRPTGYLAIIDKYSKDRKRERGDDDGGYGNDRKKARY